MEKRKGQVRGKGKGGRATPERRWAPGLHPSLPARGHSVATGSIKLPLAWECGSGYLATQRAPV